MKNEQHNAQRRKAYQAKKWLEEIRENLNNGDASYQDLVNLSDLRAFISWDDVELLEAAGIPEDVYNLMNRIHMGRDKARYTIIVDNIGEVDRFKSKKEAVKEYLIWMEESSMTYGKASGESVYLLRNGKPVCEYLTNN